MKMIDSPRRHHYLATVGILLITVALIAGTAGCHVEPPLQCDLSISSTEGGSVTIPGEQTFTYNRTTVVSLMAVADGGCQFIKWTGDVATIEDVNAASTNITMNATCSVTAIFAMEIWDWDGLNATRDNLGGKYVLMTDLDSTSTGYEDQASSTANEEQGWQPIGTESQPFAGGLYGQGHQIRDLSIDRPEEEAVGLFGFVGKGGVIENLGLVNATVSGHEHVGALVGSNSEGIVNNSYSTGSAGSVRGYLRIGGLVGWNRGTVSKSYSTVRVTYARSVGGLVGYNIGTVSDSYSGGSVSGFEYVGGLIGTNHGGGAVNNCYSTTTVTYELPPKGGLVGVNYMFLGGVKDSFWDTETSGLDSSAGGEGKNSTEMKDMDTFSGAGWSITAVANPDTRNPSSVWNIVDSETYPFLSWEPVS